MSRNRVSYTGSRRRRRGTTVRTVTFRFSGIRPALVRPELRGQQAQPGPWGLPVRQEQPARRARQELRVQLEQRDRLALLELSARRDQLDLPGLSVRRVRLGLQV